MINGMDNLPFKDIARVVNLLLLGMLIGILYLIRKRKIYTIILLTVLFLGCRWFAYETFGGTSPHPQFRLFPIWISSSLFGINNFAFQLSSIFGLALLMMQVHKFLEKKVPLPLTIITVLACGTIPVLLHAGTIVEPSIWASLFVTILLIQFYKKNQTNWIW